MSGRRVRIKLQSALRLRIGISEVPVKDTFGFAKVAMRLRIFLIKQIAFKAASFDEG